MTPLSSRIGPLTLGLSLVMLVAGCSASDSTQDAGPAAGPAELILPEGFTAEVFAEGVGRARHLAVDERGRVYVRLKSSNDGLGVVVLADEDGDGVAEREERFHESVGTGIAVSDGWLYVADERKVVRYRLGETLIPAGSPETVVVDLPEQDQHGARSIALDGEGSLYVNVGAPSNACQAERRTEGSPGLSPCPQLESFAGIWRFGAEGPPRSQDEGVRHVTGLRHAVALAWSSRWEGLYLVQHGRDQLDQLFPENYDEEANANLPAEEFHRADEGADFGWPYTYWDPNEGVRRIAPEYGGDGLREAEAGRYTEPLLGFPAHWAPNGLFFYEGDAFPERYRGGAFVAFHGSWNRYPLPQGGYNVVFVPMEKGRPTGEWEIFMDGFPGVDNVRTPRDAEYRPMGLGMLPDGSLLVSDSKQGRIWRVRWAAE